MSNHPGPSTPQHHGAYLLVGLLLALALQTGSGGRMMSVEGTQAVASAEQLTAFNKTQLCRLGDAGTPHAAHDEQGDHCPVCFVHLVAGRPAAAEEGAERGIPALPPGEARPAAGSAVRLADPRAPPGPV